MTTYGGSHRRPTVGPFLPPSASLPIPLLGSPSHPFLEDRYIPYSSALLILDLNGLSPPLHKSFFSPLDKGFLSPPISPHTSLAKLPASEVDFPPITASFLHPLPNLSPAPNLHIPREALSLHSLRVRWLSQGTSDIDPRRDGRVVDCGGLENRCTARYRGFESLSLRKEASK